MFPLGADPGFISDAIASGNPASISFRAGVYGIPKKKDQPGKATGMVSDFFNTSKSSSLKTSK